MRNQLFFPDGLPSVCRMQQEQLCPVEVQGGQTPGLLGLRHVLEMMYIGLVVSIEPRCQERP